MTAPNWRRPEVDAVAPQLQRLNDFFEGTDAVRERIAKYVPKFEAEFEHNYRSRSTGAVPPGMLTRTVEGSCGRLFAVAPKLEPNGYARIADEWQDIDGLGTHGDVWLSKAAAYGILDGFCVVLVDAPTAPAPLVPLPDAARYRPRWIRYRRNQVLNWRTSVVDGKTVLTLLVLAEAADVTDGAWGMMREDRVRVLRRENGLVTAEVWAEREVQGKGKQWQLVGGPTAYDGPTEIPVAVLAGGKLTEPFCARPPLLALCDKMIEYFRCATNIAHYEERTCYPQPVVIGQLIDPPADGRLRLGPSSVVNVEVGGNFRFEELTGNSMQQLRENQRDRRQEIGALGLSFLVTETRSAETAKAKALDAAAENATLADAARGIEDGTNQALVWHAAYANVPDDQAPTISINKNLSGEVIDAALARVLLDMRRERELTFEELRTIFARGRIIPTEMAELSAVQQAEIELALRGSGVTDPAMEATLRDVTAA